jgi:hypothetical protein
MRRQCSFSEGAKSLGGSLCRTMGTSWLANPWRVAAVAVPRCRAPAASCSQIVSRLMTFAEVVKWNGRPPGSLRNTQGPLLMPASVSRGATPLFLPRCGNKSSSVCASQRGTARLVFLRAQALYPRHRKGTAARFAQGGMTTCASLRRFICRLQNRRRR